MASIKDLKRMCTSYDECGKCPLFDVKGTSCHLPSNFPDNTDEIVNKWVAEHPVKTYAMDFFEKFPNASRHGYGVPKVCLKHVYGDGTHCSFSSYSCTECWNREMKEGAEK